MKQEDLKKIYMLTESFINEVEKNQLNEGFTDTAKAKWAGFKGGIKGLGKQIQGGVNKATGNVLDKGITYVSKGLGGDPNKSPWAKSAKNLAKKGQSQIDTGKSLAYTEKYNTYISSVVDSIINDLKDLNININNKNKLVSDIKKSITNNTEAPQKQSSAKQSPVASSQKQQTPTASSQKQQAPVASSQKQQTPTASSQKQQTTIGNSGKQTTKNLGQKNINNNKNLYAGQWLSPTERVSLLGIQGGKMKVDPNDPSQVENPFSPKYNEKVANAKIATKTGKSTTINEPKKKEEPQQVDPKKEQARNIVKSKMGK